MRWLSFLTLLPLAGALVSALALALNRLWAGRAVRVFAWATVACAVWLFLDYRPVTDDVASLHVIELPFLLIPAWRLAYAPSADGVSLLLAMLAAFLTALTCGGRDRPGIKRGAVQLAATGCVIGAYFATDLMLFYILAESALALALALAAMSAPGARETAANALRFQALTGAPMLLAILAMHWHGGGDSFLAGDLLKSGLRFTTAGQLLLLAAFAVTLCARIPVPPLHAWLVDVHEKSHPILAVTLFTLAAQPAAYGFFRFMLPMFPGAPEAAWSAISLAAAVGILYMGMIAYAKASPTALLTYARAAMACLPVVGFTSVTRPAVAGAVFLLFGQGLVFGAAFLILASLERRGNPALDSLAFTMPRLTTLAAVTILALIGLPGSEGFISQLLTLAGSFRTQPVITAVAALGLAPIGVALTTFVLRTSRTRPEPGFAPPAGLRKGETAPIAALLFFTLLLGIYPKIVLDRLNPSVDGFCEEVRHRRAVVRAMERPVRAVEDPSDPAAGKNPPIIVPEGL